jgi:ankyrin repeat protein
MNSLPTTTECSEEERGVHLQEDDEKDEEDVTLFNSTSHSLVITTQLHEEEHDHAPIDCLPQEILSYIFELVDFAPVLAGVKRRWASAYDASVRFYMTEEEVDAMFWQKSYSELGYFFTALERRYRMRQGVIATVELASLLFGRAAEFGRLSLLEVMTNSNSSLSPSSSLTSGFSSSTSAYSSSSASSFLSSSPTSSSSAFSLLSSSPSSPSSSSPTSSFSSSLEHLNKEEVVRFRIDPGAREDWAIRWASRNGHSEVVRFLLGLRGVDPSAKTNYSIRWACENGHVEIVRLLLADDRCNPSDQNNAALLWASVNGHPQVVKMLLSSLRVEPSSKVNEALRMAKQHVEDRFATSSYSSSSPLLPIPPGSSASSSSTCSSSSSSTPSKEDEELLKRIEVVHLLLADPRVDYSAKNNLRWASSLGLSSIVYLLIHERQIDPTFDNNDALKLACTNGHRWRHDALLSTSLSFFPSPSLLLLLLLDISHLTIFLRLVIVRSSGYCFQIPE